METLPIFRQKTKMKVKVEISSDFISSANDKDLEFSLSETLHQKYQTWSVSLFQLSITWVFSSISPKFTIAFAGLN